MRKRLWVYYIIAEKRLLISSEELFQHSMLSNAQYDEEVEGSEHLARMLLNMYCCGFIIGARGTINEPVNDIKEFE